MNSSQQLYERITEKLENLIEPGYHAFSDGRLVTFWYVDDKDIVLEIEGGKVTLCESCSLWWDPVYPDSLEFDDVVEFLSTYLEAEDQAPEENFPLTVYFWKKRCEDLEDLVYAMWKLHPFGFHDLTPEQLNLMDTAKGFSSYYRPTKESEL